MKNRNKTLSLSIMSGKGGVGKTNLALSIGYGLFKAGNPVLLMDCDLGLANLDVLLGLSPEKNLQDLLRPDVGARDVLAAIEPGGLDFLPAASGVPELVDMDEDMQETISGKLTDLLGNYAYVILDLGAGLNQTVLSFASVTHLRLVVVTPEPTSLTDSYALMKVLFTQYGIEDFYVVINQAESPAEAKQTFARLHAACLKFLNINIRLLGAVRHDPTVTEAVRRQTLLMKFAPSAPASKDILGLAKSLERMRRERLDSLADEPVLKKFPVR
jgi:flagellar biosynthesis protein FlhG